MPYIDPNGWAKLASVVGTDENDEEKGMLVFMIAGSL